MEIAPKAGNLPPGWIQAVVFTEEQLQRLHTATLEVLATTGIKVESEQALELFSGIGARVERQAEHGMVRFSSDIIEKYIRLAPSRLIYPGREAEFDFDAAADRLGFSTFGECVQIIDPQTRRVRSTTKDDLGRITRICDRLEEICVVERPVGSLDKPPATQPLHNYEVMATNTGKHIFLGFFNAANTRRIAWMAAACVGGDEVFSKRKPVSAFVCPTSPLVLGEMCCDVTIECARLGIGVAPISMVLAGATAPVTLAGSIVIHNAEVLSTIVLAQAAASGTPCTYASMSTIMDLRTAMPATAAPEHGLISAGLTQLAQMYHLPCWVGGGVADSKLPDTQAAYDFSLSATMAAMSHPNFFYGAGALESGLTFDYAKLIMDCEQMRQIQHLLKGVAVTQDTLALDIIAKAGAGGEFMTLEHTFNNMRSLSITDLFDRRSRASWMDMTAGRDLTERAYERARDIASSHEPPPLPRGAAQAMRHIIDDYEAELKLH